VKIDSDEVKRVAALAHLEFDEPGLERMAAELSKVLEYIDQLRELDGGEAPAESDETSTPLREDVVTASLPRESVERNAPAWSDGLFVVPQVIGGE